MRVIYGRASQTPALGADKTVMGHAWWHWLPAVGWMDMPIAGGRMRGVQARWLCFFCDICHLSRPKS